MSTLASPHSDQQVQLAGMVHDLTDQLAQAQEKIKQLTYRNDQLTEAWRLGPGARIQALADQAQAAEQERNRLLSRETQAQKRVAHLEASCKALRDSHITARNSLTTIKQQSTRMADLVASKEREKRTLATHIDMQDAQIRNLRDDLLEPMQTLRSLMHFVGMISLGAPTPPPVGPKLITYVIRPDIDITKLRGATTSMPPVQRTLDVYALLSPVLTGLDLPKELPIVMATSTDTGSKNLTVVQGSNADIALAGFPSLVVRSS